MWLCRFLLFGPHTCNPTPKTVQSANQMENSGMTIVNGYDDGKRVVLDEPVPERISTPTPVKVVFEEDAGGLLDDLARLVGPSDLPPDYSQQHDHYVKGTPRR